MKNIEIERISYKDTEKIENLIKAYPFKPYYYIKQSKEEYNLKLFKAIISELISKTTNFLFVAKNRLEYVGFVFCEKKDWDSDFFGFNFYEIGHIFVLGSHKQQIEIKKMLINSVFNLCPHKKVRYISVKVDAKDITSVYALESQGFNLLSSVLHFSYIVKQPRRHFKYLSKIRDYQDYDLESLRSIARNSMKYDHFHMDKGIPREKSDNMYVTLIENCCKGVCADKVFVAERLKKAVGYVACQIKRDLINVFPFSIGHIRHLAVSYPEGFGCGPGLQEAALSWLEGKVDIIESSTTIQNYPIMKISLRSGMEIISSYLRFSRWF